MSLKEMMIRLKNRGSDTPDTPEKNTGYQLEPIFHAGCTPETPETPCFSDTHETAQKMPPEAQIVEYRLYSKLQPPPETKTPSVAVAVDVPTVVADWKGLARAYLLHHGNCPTCIAASRGSRYGLRCGVGAALWQHYGDAP